MPRILSPINSTLGGLSKEARGPHVVSLASVHWNTLQRFTAAFKEIDPRVTLLPFKGRAAVWRNLQRTVPLGVMMGLRVCIQNLWVQVQTLPLTPGNSESISWLLLNLSGWGNWGFTQHSFNKHSLSTCHEPDAVQSHGDCRPSHVTGWREGQSDSWGPGSAHQWWWYLNVVSILRPWWSKPHLFPQQVLYSSRQYSLIFMPKQRD